MFEFLSWMNLDSFYIDKILGIFNFIVNYTNMIYDYIYPFFIKYILLLKLNPLYSIIFWLLAFNFFYIANLKLTKNNFNIIIYLLWLILFPIFNIIFRLLFIDSLIKKIIYAIFWLKYPYTPRKIKKEMQELEKLFKVKNDYHSRFSWNPFEKKSK